MSDKENIDNIDAENITFESSSEEVKVVTEVGTAIAQVDLNEKGEPVIVDGRIVCVRCKVRRDPGEFGKCTGRRNGRQAYCKACMKDRQVMVRTGKIPLKVGNSETRDITNLRIKKMAHILIDKPDMEVVELAKEVGLAPSTVQGYLSSNKILRAFRGVGAKAISRMVPESIRAYRDILNQRVNLGEANKVATKILENEKIIGPNRMDIGIVEMKEQSNEQLMRIVKEAQEFPAQVIQEAEVVE